MIKERIYYVILFMSLFSCGFYSFTGASISNDIKTVYIDYFENKSSTVNPTLSSVFTETLKDYFISNTRLNLTENDGDLSFTGEITNYSIKPISIQSNETASQNRLKIIVKVKFNNKTDKSYDFHTSFSRYKDFSSNEDLSIIEDNLISEICEELAEDIFNKSIVNW